MKSLGGGVSPILSFGLWIIHLISGKVKKMKRAQKQAEAAAFAVEHEYDVRKANIDAMSRVVDCHGGYSAEVFNVFVFGSRRVSVFRLLGPGDEVDMKKTRDGIKVFAFGEYMADVVEPATSHLSELFDKGGPFDAYLGGRDRAYIYDDGCDFCSVMIFYKLPGVPPANVNLK